MAAAQINVCRADWIEAFTAAEAANSKMLR
jgi:hypothetical protein